MADAAAAVDVGHSYRMISSANVQDAVDKLKVTFHGYFSGPHPDDSSFPDFLLARWKEAHVKHGKDAFMLLSLAVPEIDQVPPQSAPGVPAKMKTGLVLHEPETVARGLQKAVPHVPVVSFVSDSEDKSGMIIMTRYWGFPEDAPEIIFIPRRLPVDPHTGEIQPVFYRHESPRDIVTGEEAEKRVAAAQKLDVTVDNDAIPGSEFPAT